MSRFFWKCGLFGLLIALSAVAMGVLSHYTQDQTSLYYAALADKHAALKATPSPRLMIVGGSSTAFGVDSALLEKELGMPVVNLGLHAGLGLRFMLSEAASFMRPGDVVLISPEYEQFFDATMEGADALNKTLIAYPEALKYLTSWRQFLELALNYPHFMGDFLLSLPHAFLSKKDDVYVRTGFDRRGDLISYLNTPSRSPEDIAEMTFLDHHSTMNRRAIAVLNDFAEAASTSVKSFMIFPWIPEPQLQKRKVAMAELSAAFRDRCRLKTLGDPSTNTLPADCFYDSIYHLNGKGRALRTQTWIKYLREAIHVR